MSQHLNHEFFTHERIAPGKTIRVHRQTGPMFRTETVSWKLMIPKSANGQNTTKKTNHKKDASVILDKHLIEAVELFGSAREIQIAHRGDIYRLRITAQQKLILTK
ncbi:MAG: hemin uptake protein HemP [Cohaesibacter sp.]|nr:hemin uptake protein HemP [Cohaesibacter sp.]